MHFVCQNLTCSFICCSVDAGLERIWNVLISLTYICIISLDLLHFVLQLWPLDASIVCKFNFLLSCRSPIVSHVIFSMFISLISHILSSAGPSPGTTKNPHLVSLFFKFTVHTPNCSVPGWLHVLMWLNCFCCIEGCFCWFRE